MKKLLAMALSLSTIISGATMATSIYASAEDDPTVSIVETTTEAATNDNESEVTTESVTTEIVTTTAVSVDNINTTQTTVAEEATTETVTTTEWDRVSNWPDENGHLRFLMDYLEEGKMSSISLTYTAEDNNKPISGAKVSVYKIASVTVLPQSSYTDGGSAEYTLVDELKEAYPELDFAGMSNEDLDNLALELCEKGLKVAAEAETDSNGACKLENLEPGLYLIRQTAQVGIAKDYEEFKPFILNAPFPETQDDVYNGHWMYDVEALPKTTLKGKKKLLIIPPQTGDETNENLLKLAGVALGISSITTIGAVYLIAKKKKENE